MKDENGAMNSALALLEACYRESGPQMVRFATRLLDNPGLAEVVVQDCFVHALKHIEAFEKSPKPVGWLYEVLKKLILHAIRDRETNLKRIVQLDEVCDLHLSTCDQYASGLLEDTNDPNLRLLVQSYIYGYSLKDLAEHYGKNVGTIKMRIKRAKERIKKRL